MHRLAVHALVPCLLVPLAAAAALSVAFAASPGRPPPIGAIPVPELITRLDRNGNGCVDLEEGRNYTSRRFHALDRNGDETLDAVEAPPGADETTNSRPITLADWQDAYQARFDSFDTDRSGCLSPAEIEAGRAALATGGH